MCVNCNLLTPILDVVCDKLGIEKGKYLTMSHYIAFQSIWDVTDQTNNMYINYTNASSEHFKFKSDTLVQTSDGNPKIGSLFAVRSEIFMSMDDFNGITPSKEIEYEGEKIPLFTGKFKQVKDVPFYRYVENFTEFERNHVDILVADPRFYDLINKEPVTEDEAKECLKKYQEWRNN